MGCFLSVVYFDLAIDNEIDVKHFYTLHLLRSFEIILIKVLETIRQAFA